MTSPKIPIKEKIIYANYGSLCGCSNRRTVAACQCEFCAELDSEGNIITREGYDDINGTTAVTLPHYREGGEYEYGTNIGSVAPCVLEVSITSVANYPVSQSYCNRCLNYNKTVYAYFGNFVRDDNAFLTSREYELYYPGCVWHFSLCKGTDLEDACGADKGYLFLSTDVTETPVNNIKNVYLYCIIYQSYVSRGRTNTSPINQNQVTSQDEVTLFKRVKVGEIELVNGTPSSGYANSDVLCRNWSALSLSETVIYDPITGDPVDYFNICDTSLASVSVTSVNPNDYLNIQNTHDRITWDKKDCGDTGGLTNPWLVQLYSCGSGVNAGKYDFINYTYQVSTKLTDGYAYFTCNNLFDPYENSSYAKTYTDRFNREIPYISKPAAVKVTITGVENDHCDNCTQYNGEHILLGGYDSPNAASLNLSYCDYYKPLSNDWDLAPEITGQPYTIPCYPNYACSGLNTPYMIFSFNDPSESLGSQFELNNGFTYNLSHGYINPEDFTLNGFLSSVVENRYCNFDNVSVQVEPYEIDSSKSIPCIAHEDNCGLCYGDAPEQIMITIPDNWKPNAHVMFNSGCYPLSPFSQLKMGAHLCCENGVVDTNKAPVGAFILDRFNSSRTIPSVDGCGTAYNSSQQTVATGEEWLPSCSWIYYNPDRSPCISHPKGFNTLKGVRSDYNNTAFFTGKLTGSDSGGMNLCEWDYMVFNITKLNTTQLKYDFSIVNTRYAKLPTSVGNELVPPVFCQSESGVTQIYPLNWSATTNPLTDTTYGNGVTFNFTKIVTNPYNFEGTRYVDCSNLDDNLFLTSNPASGGFIENFFGGTSIPYRWGQGFTGRKGTVPYIILNNNGYTAPGARFPNLMLAEYTCSYTENPGDTGIPIHVQSI